MNCEEEQRLVHEIFLNVFLENDKTKFKTFKIFVFHFLFCRIFVYLFLFYISILKIYFLVVVAEETHSRNLCNSFGFHSISNVDDDSKPKKKTI